MAPPHVADLVRNSPDRDTGAGEQLVESGDLVVTEILRAVQHHGRQARSSVGPIGGEAYVRQESLPILALAAGLHYGAKRLARSIVPEDIGQGRQVAIDGLARQIAGRQHQHAVSSFVCGQYTAVSTGCKDGYGTGFNQDS